MHAYFALVIGIMIEITVSIGQCGPDYYIPEEASDCTEWSNLTHACCYMKMDDAPAPYKTCFAMVLEDVTPIISIGKLVYRIDCQGITDYSTLFPLETIKTACGVQNPTILSDCWTHNSETDRCCMVGKTNQLLNAENPMCYYFPDNEEFKVENFTITDRNGATMFVGCSTSFIQLSLLTAFVFFGLLF